ncbi:MAG: pyrroline-5-carboxylate reductase [Veillonellales bacterium]
MLQNKKIGFIGGGAMAEALLRGILKAKLAAPQQIILSDIIDSRLKYLTDTYSVSTTTNSRAVAKQADLLFFTVKPQVLADVLDTVASAVSKATLVVSIVAGATLATLQEQLAEVPIIRVMPNTPVAVGEGMAALALGQYADSGQGQMVSEIFASSGKAVLVNESLMDAVTGLSGSGPGYAFVMIDALADAGVQVGLPRQTALTLAAQTMLGAAKMVLETGEHPAKLRDMVTSPGGTTIAGIHVLEQRGIRAALIDAVIAATNRSLEMGRKK